MISESLLYEKKYGMQFPGLTLTGIYELQIPAQLLKLRYVGEEVSSLGPLSEFVLRFVELGINQIGQISAAMGLPDELLQSVISSEIELNRVKENAALGTFHLTPHGRDILSDLLAKSPVRGDAEMIFDLCSRKLESWPAQTLRADKDTRALSNPPKAFPPGVEFKPHKSNELSERSLTIHLAPRPNKKTPGTSKVEVLEIQKASVKKRGSVFSKLLVWQDASAVEVAFLIETNGDRSFAHESFLSQNGGLATLGIHPEPIQMHEKAEVVLAAGQPSASSDEDTLLELSNELGATQHTPDGGSVRPADHKAYLEFALRNTRQRLVIVAPWITPWVVDSQFLEQLELLLRVRGVEVTIAWGFEDKSGRHKQRNHQGTLSKLLALSDKYPDFHFIKLDQSHIKVLLFDNNYICTSHNWLSYSGDQPRLEWGEKRTNPSVVDDRYLELMNLLPAAGHKATTKDLARISG